MKLSDPPDFSRIVEYLAVFLKLPELAHSHAEFVERLILHPPKWLTKTRPNNQELDLAYAKHVDAEQHLFDLLQGVKAVTEGMLALAKSRYSPQNCTMIHANSNTIYPFHKEIAQPVSFVRVSLADLPVGLWRKLGLRDITLHTGVSYKTKLPVAQFGLLFQQDTRLTISTIELDGHLTTIDLVPSVSSNHLANFSLGVASARNVFDLQKRPYLPPAPGVALDPPRDSEWLASHLPELADRLQAAYDS